MARNIPAEMLGNSTGSGVSDGRDIIKKGDYAFSGSGYSNNVAIWNVSDPENPELESTIGNNLDFVRAVERERDSDYIFASGRDSNNVVVFDVSDINNPSFVDEFSDPDLAGARGLKLDTDRDILYLAIGSFNEPSEPNGIALLDVSDPTNLTAHSINMNDISGIQSGGNVRIHPNDRNTVYMSEYRGDSLMVFDTSDPENISVEVNAESSETSSARDLSISNDATRLYMSDADGGMSVWDIGGDRKTNPEQLDYLDDAELGGARGQFLFDGYVYVSCRGSNKMVVVDTEGDNLSVVDSIEDNTVLNQAYGVFVDTDERIVYTASAENGYIGVFGEILDKNNISTGGGV